MDTANNLENLLQITSQPHAQYGATARQARNLIIKAAAVTNLYADLTADMPMALKHETGIILRLANDYYTSVYKKELDPLLEAKIIGSMLELIALVGWSSELGKVDLFETYISLSP
jgi:hypothetical protein